MTLDGAAKPPGGVDLGRRFLLTGYLPAYSALVFLLVLVWAGARGWAGDHRIDFRRAWVTAAGLGVGEVLLLALGVLLTAILLQPLQLAMVRILEGSWPSWLGSGLAMRWQRARRARLARVAELPQDDPAALTEEIVQRAGQAGAELLRRFPLPEHLLRPTGLGNALAAMEDTAGRAYGLDAVVVWPRLHAVLGDKVAATVNDRRDVLDTAARMTVILAATAVAAFVLLGWSGPWVLLATVPVALAALSYLGAVHAALAYGEAVQVAFDLHRFDLLAALRLGEPTRRDEELRNNEQLSDFWRQGVPLPDASAYIHGGKDPK